MDGLLRGQVLNLQNCFVRQRLSGGASISRNLATNHEANNLGEFGGLGIDGADVLTIAQNRDAVGELLELRHTVRDEDQAGFRSNEVTNKLEQGFGLSRGQRSCGLVHDQDLR